VIIDGQKTDGVESILKDCRARGGDVSSVFAKAHGKVFTLSGGDFSDWAASGPTEIEGGFITDAGVFSADAVDRGSAALVAALPADLKGHVGDLGAGWGYLSHHVLKSDAVTGCHLIEAEHAALECARQNITDPRAQFHWADGRNFTADRGFDHIVTNPPFHTGRAADADLGRAFITAASRLLARRGAVWLVANRHLPYEQHLSETFKEVDEVAGDKSFKVFRAAIARPLKR
jgi:16S rRNA (guanine1207-N2)-methyltransferase